MGFNSGLELTNEEKSFLSDNISNGSGDAAAQQVLARRLVTSVVFSHNNPNELTTLPSRESLYDGILIPSVEQSIDVLRKYMSAKSITKMSVIAGVDEVQWLNEEFPSVLLEEKHPPERERKSRIGLGRYFLRLLRQWQIEWRTKMNVHILPLGTGIALHWDENDRTHGQNLRIVGGDSTLISKDDFRTLVCEIVQRMDPDKFSRAFGARTNMDTIINLAAAVYWPRPRLLEWLKYGNSALPESFERIDAGADAWLLWLCKWMLDTSIRPDDGIYMPGQAENPEHPSNGRITALFELTQKGVSVIPDGYNSSSILNVLTRKLPLEKVYFRLQPLFDDLHPLQVPKDGYGFETIGFDVVAAAIHIGAYAVIHSKVNHTSISSTAKKRVGLGMWFLRNGALKEQTVDNWPEPIFLGSHVPTNIVGNYYPFGSQQQNVFDDDVKKTIRSVIQEKRPLYICCGKNTCCDYLYFYPTAEGQLVANIDDAKHTSTPEPSQSGNAITGEDQKGLYDAAVKVNRAIEDMGLKLIAVRLLFVTNRMSFSDSKRSNVAEAKAAARKIWSDVELELLNPSTFDFGPFSDILMARRRKDLDSTTTIGQKRKTEY